jgi:hypothetical protein
LAVSCIRLEVTLVGFHNCSGTNEQLRCSTVAPSTLLAPRTCKHLPLRALRSAK